MAIGTKLREIRKQNGFSVQYAAQQLGLSPATIYRYENGSIEKIPSHIVTELCRLYGATPAQIFGWEESPFTISGIEPMPSMRSVPRLGTIACGEPILATENLSGQDEIPVGIDCDFTLICKGDSMIGARIHDGDIVCIRQQPTVENGQIAAVLIDDEATLKRVYIYPNQIVLSAENPAYAPMIYTDDNRHQIRILGLAVYFISRLH